MLSPRTYAVTASWIFTPSPRPATTYPGLIVMSVVIADGRSAFGTVRRNRKLLSNRSPIMRRLRFTVARPLAYAARNDPECRGRRSSGWPGWDCWLRLLCRHTLLRTYVT